MSQRGKKIVSGLMTSIVIMLTVTLSVQAGDMMEMGPNTGKVSVSAGSDWTSAYFFRGILQEDQGLILQPWAELGLNLGRVDLSLGSWNSFHDEQTGAGEDTTSDSWYEADFYLGLATPINEMLSLSVTYTSYTSPNDAFDTVNDLAFGLGYDDSGSEGLALNPSLTVIFETDGQADQNGEPTGTDEGVYVEIAIAPSFSPSADGALSNLSVEVPVTLGLSAEDYFEDGDGDDDTFGYLDIGIEGSLPLAVPADSGVWSLTAGVHFLYLGDNLEQINNDDDFEVIGTLGVSMEY